MDPLQRGSHQRRANERAFLFQQADQQRCNMNCFGILGCDGHSFNNAPYYGGFFNLQDQRQMQQSTHNGSIVRRGASEAMFPSKTESRSTTPPEQHSIEAPLPHSSDPPFQDPELRSADALLAKELNSHSLEARNRVFAEIQ